MEQLFDRHTIIPLFGMLVGIIAILLPIGIIWLVLHYRNRRNDALYETVKHLADKGLPVPPELLDPPQAKNDRESPLFRAITLLGVGIGLGLMFWFLDLKFLVGIGALLLCIGIAQIIALMIERRRGDAA